MNCLQEGEFCSETKLRLHGDMAPSTHPSTLHMGVGLTPPLGEGVLLLRVAARANNCPAAPLDFLLSPLRCCSLAPVEERSSLWCAMSGALGHLGIPDPRSPRSSEATLTCGTANDEGRSFVIQSPPSGQIPIFSGSLLS